MQFYTADWNAKRHAKRLKKVLRQHGHNVSYTWCLNLIARLYRFADFAQMRRMSGGKPNSDFDHHVDDDMLESRFQHQECVMAEAGFADIAGAVLDEVNPTGLSSQLTADVVQVDSIGISETNDGVEGAARSRR